MNVSYLLKKCKKLIRKESCIGTGNSTEAEREFSFDGGQNILFMKKPLWFGLWFKIVQHIFPQQNNFLPSPLKLNIKRFQSPNRLFDVTSSSLIMLYYFFESEIHCFHVFPIWWVGLSNESIY